jgi:hypothetical protein
MEMHSALHTVQYLIAGGKTSDPVVRCVCVCVCVCVCACVCVWTSL